MGDKYDKDLKRAGKLGPKLRERVLKKFGTLKEEGKLLALCTGLNDGTASQYIGGYCRRSLVTISDDRRRPTPDIRYVTGLSRLSGNFLTINIPVRLGDISLVIARAKS